MQLLSKQAFDGRRDSAWFVSDGTKRTFTATLAVDSPLNDPSLSIRILLHAQGDEDDAGRIVQSDEFVGAITGPLQVTWQGGAKIVWASVIASRVITAGLDISAS